MRNKDISYHFGFHRRTKDEPSQFRFDIDLQQEIQGWKPEFSPGGVELVRTEPELSPLYSYRQIQSVVSIINSVLTKNISTLRDDDLRCVVLTKDPYRKSGTNIQKHGLHIQYPDIYIPNNEFISLVKDINSRLTKVFSSSIFTPDDAFPNNCWLVYGASKKDDILYYKATYFLNRNCDQVEPFCPESDFISLFWMFPKSDSKIFYIDTYRDEPDEDDSEPESDEPEEEISTNEERITFIKLKLNGLKPFRVEQSKYWFKILNAVKNYATEHFTNLQPIKDMMDEWSQTTSKNNYSKDSFERSWEADGKYKIGTLIAMWKQDNKEICLFMEGTDDSIAQLCYLRYQGSIYMKNPLEGFLYNEKKRLWKPVENYEIYNHCLEYLKDLSDQILVYLNKEGALCQTSEEKQAHKDKLRVHKRISAQIQTDVMRKKIPSALTHYCLDPDFELKLNSIPYLFPIRKHKVVDLRTKEVRERKQDDFFTFQSKVKVVDTNTRAKAFFDSLANGDQELSTFLQTHLVYCLSGFTFDRSFYQLIGIGMNGKSTYVDIISDLLQDTFAVGQKKMIVKDTKHGNRNEEANPFLINCRGKRVVAFCETESDDLLNSSQLKALTGGDKISSRLLFSNKIETFKNTSKILIATNFPLAFYNDDKAVKDRFKNIPFNRTFEKDEEFKNNLLSNVDGMMDEIFSLCLQTGSDYLQRQKLPVCKTIEESTQNLFDDFDVVQKFIDESCDTSDKNFKISSKKLYQEFRYFCGDEITPVSDKLFCQQMKKKGFDKGRVQIDGVKYQAFIGIKLSHHEQL
jgi:P4 family phage/plasmid primase-like protien